MPRAGRRKRVQEASGCRILVHQRQPRKDQEGRLHGTLTLREGCGMPRRRTIHEAVVVGIRASRCTGIIHGAITFHARVPGEHGDDGGYVDPSPPGTHQRTPAGFPSLR